MDERDTSVTRHLTRIRELEEQLQVLISLCGVRE
jgi:hypothetical protein